MTLALTYNNINPVEDCGVIRSDLVTVYNWDDVNNMCFSANKLHYLYNVLLFNV